MKVKNRILSFKLLVTSCNGFTLAELLAVAGILVILSAVVGSILVSTLRGSNKTRITTSGAQNGDYVISVISSAINNSKEFGYINGATRYTSCIAGNPPVQAISVDNFADITPPQPTNPPQSLIECKDIDSGPAVVNAFTINNVSIMNTDEVVVESCAAGVFTCTQANNYTPPIVTLKFTLIQKSSSGLFEAQTASPFSSSISVRNFAK